MHHNSCYKNGYNSIRMWAMYRPGNIIYVHYWRSYDIVLSFDSTTQQATVQECTVEGIPFGPRRSHWTMPDSEDVVIGRYEG